MWDSNGNTAPLWGGYASHTGGWGIRQETGSLWYNLLFVFFE